MWNKRLLPSDDSHWAVMHMDQILLVLCKLSVGLKWALQSSYFLFVFFLWFSDHNWRQVRTALFIIEWRTCDIQSLREKHYLLFHIVSWLLKKRKKKIIKIWLIAFSESQVCIFFSHLFSLLQITIPHALNYIQNPPASLKLRVSHTPLYRGVFHILVLQLLNWIFYREGTREFSFTSLPFSAFSVLSVFPAVTEILLSFSGCSRGTEKSVKWLALGCTETLSQIRIWYC